RVKSIESKLRRSVFENGIKAASPFLKLNTFNIVDGFTVDIMHCVYLGIVRTLTNLWLEASHSDYYIGKAKYAETLEVSKPISIGKQPNGDRGYLLRLLCLKEYCQNSLLNIFKS
ncbi:hypothetical protein Ocin01_20051, partial [Orchesella cincta]